MRRPPGRAGLGPHPPRRAGRSTCRSAPSGTTTCWTPAPTPCMAVIGSLASELRPGERILARLLLRSLGPEWSQAHQARAHKQAVPENREPSYTYQTRPLQVDGVTMAVLGAGALGRRPGLPVGAGRGDSSRRRCWALGSASSGIIVAGWCWWRWKTGPQPGLRPLADHQGEGGPHRLRGRAPGHRRPARTQHVGEQRARGGPGARWPPPTATTTTPPGPGSR